MIMLLSNTPFKIMNKSLYISLFALIAAAPVWAQNSTKSDTASIDRTVTVVREFQPTVQQVGKIAVKPQVYEPQLEVQDPQYSGFTNPLATDYNLKKLDFSSLNFVQAEPMHGYLRLGAGHVNSLFDFNYRVTDSQMASKKKKAANDMILDLHAHHMGQWGRKTISESALGMDFSKQFRKVELFFGATGGNDFYTRYGAYYDPSLPSTLSVDHYRDIHDSLRQSVWTVDTRLGIKNVPGAMFKYLLQAGYESFVMPQFATEHQVHTQGMFDWHKNQHAAGVELDIQNRIYSAHDTTVARFATDNHRIHIEPFYEYDGKRIHLHAGVNLDFSAGRGRVAGISPNVRFEADLTQNWLAAYINATGNYDANGARGEYNENRYRYKYCLFNDNLSGEYTPIDAQIGFKIRPYATLALDIHAGYNLTLDRHINVFGMTHTPMGDFEHELQSQSTWNVGATLKYHHRDVVFLHAEGAYLAGPAHNDVFGLLNDQGENVTFDRASWYARLRVDGKINAKWSLYSDNFFEGSRSVCVYNQTTNAPEVATLRPRFDLNLGVKYNINKWMFAYAQVNNYLAWTSKLSWSTFYGYEAQRANCMLGFSMVF